VTGYQDEGTNKIHQVLAPVGWVWWLKIEREIQIGEAPDALARGNRDPEAGDLGDEERTDADHSGSVNKNPSWCTRQQKGFRANKKKKLH
jgi:hypothetical protein